MYKETLSSILNVEIYATIGFFIFFIFFIFITIRAFKMNKDEVAIISNMPLDDQDQENRNALS
jgi:cbb3-type cytochrome oxidase subunit 3